MATRKPSGAQYRKRRKREQAETQGRLVAVGESWLQQSAYQSASRQWDPKAPPVELPIYGVAPATLVRAVNAALAQLEQGAFYSSAVLWDGMLRDDRVASKSEERVDRLIGAPLEIRPAKDNARCEKIAEDFAAERVSIVPSAQLMKLIRNAMAMSVGIAQKTTTQTADARVPTIRVWNNRNLRYDWLLRRYCIISENRGEIVLEPGDPEWLIYEPYGPLGWLDGAKMRSLALPWIIRYWTRTWWARYQEVHGQPIRAGIIPTVRDPADERVFLTQISNLAHEAVIRLPQGQDGNKFDFKLIEAAAENWQGFKELLAHCDDSIAISWLGQSQSTKGQGGLGTQENAGESTILRLTRKDALVSEVLREQVVKPWTADNYGNADLAPYLEWQIEPADDREAKAKTDLGIAQTLVQFKAAGAPIDQRAYLTERGYGDMLLSEADHAKQKAEAVEQAQRAMSGAHDDEEAEEEQP